MARSLRISQTLALGTEEDRSEPARVFPQGTIKEKDAGRHKKRSQGKRKQADPSGWPQGDQDMWPERCAALGVGGEVCSDCGGPAAEGVVTTERQSLFQ